MTSFSALAGVAVLLFSATLRGASMHSSGHFSGGRTSSFHGSSHFSGGSSQSRFRSGFRSGFRGGFGGRFRGGWGFFGPWGWGWGWGWGPWWGYGYPYSYGYSSYGGGYGAERSRYAAVKTDVEPDEAALYLDGKLIGTADDFDGYPDMLYLGRGHYRLEFRLDGYESYTSDVDAAPGRFFKIDHRLKKIPGAKHYGTYHPAHLEGGVVRYFEKRRPRSSNSESDWRNRAGSQRYEATVGDDEAASPDEVMGADEEDDYAPPDARPAPESDDESDIEDRALTPPAATEPLPPAVSASEARIVFNVSPPDAAVYLDGHFAGSARELDGLTGGLSVPVGEHSVTVTGPGYREATIRVQASTARSARARLELKR
jgi:hypothetical protein